MTQPKDIENLEDCDEEVSMAGPRSHGLATIPSPGPFQGRQVGPSSLPASRSCFFSFKGNCTKPSDAPGYCEYHLRSERRKILAKAPMIPTYGRSLPPGAGRLKAVAYRSMSPKLRQQIPAHEREGWFAYDPSDKAQFTRVVGKDRRAMFREEYFGHPNAEPVELSEEGPAETRAHFLSLTPYQLRRELKKVERAEKHTGVIFLFAHDYTEAQIAEVSGLSERTVRTYIREAENNMLRDIKEQLDRIENGQVAIFKELIRSNPNGVAAMIEEAYSDDEDVMAALEELRRTQ
jgi:predicted transcriptional regulator